MILALRNNNNCYHFCYCDNHNTHVIIICHKLHICFVVDSTAQKILERKFVALTGSSNNVHKIIYIDKRMKLFFYTMQCRFSAWFDKLHSIGYFCFNNGKST